MDLMKANEELKMSSKEIADLTNKHHKNVMRDIDVLSNQLGGLKFELSYYTSSQGKKLPCYMLNLKQSLTVVSGYNVVLRSAIIDRWSQLEKEKLDSIQHKVPQTFAQALMLAAEQAVELEEKTKQLDIAKPKVEYHDKVLDSSSGITITTIAQELGMSGTALNKKLSELKILYKRGKKGSWFVSKKYSEKGYVLVRTSVLKNGSTKHSIVWTEAGRKFIHELINKSKNQLLLNF